MRVLLGTLWLTLACSSVHATLSKSDAKKAASKTLQEKVGGLGTLQRADHHTSFPTGGWEPTASRELHLWADSTVPLGAPAGRPQREQLLVLGPEGRPAPAGLASLPVPPGSPSPHLLPPSTPMFLPASRGESIELCQVWLWLCRFPGGPREAG